jgi:hypothetical protein
MPAGKAVPTFDRTWLALALSANVVLRRQCSIDAAVPHARVLMPATLLASASEVID